MGGSTATYTSLCSAWTSPAAPWAPWRTWTSNHSRRTSSGSPLQNSAKIERNINREYMVWSANFHHDAITPTVMSRRASSWTNHSTCPRTRDGAARGPVQTPARWTLTGCRRSLHVSRRISIVWSICRDCWHFSEAFALCVRTWAGPEDERERDGGGDGQQGRPAGLLRRGGACPRRQCRGGRWRAAEAEHGGGLGSLLSSVVACSRRWQREKRIDGWAYELCWLVEWRLRLGGMGATADLFSPEPLTMGWSGRFTLAIFSLCNIQP
jgi:hypothetical protein